MRRMPDIEELLEPLEHVISEQLIPSLTERIRVQRSVERELIALPVRMGGPGIINP